MLDFDPSQALAEATAERDQRQRELSATAAQTAGLHQDLMRLEQHLDGSQRCGVVYIKT